MQKGRVTLESISEKIDALGARTASVETELGALASRTSSLETNLSKLSVSVDELAGAVYTGFASVQEALATKADKTDIERLDNRIDETNDRIDETNKTVSLLGKSLNMKIDDLHEEVTGFTSDIYDGLSTRITMLEKKRA